MWYLEVSINGGTPKWMVHSGESIKNGWWLGVPPFPETSIFTVTRDYSGKSNHQRWKVWISDLRLIQHEGQKLVDGKWHKRRISWPFLLKEKHCSGSGSKFQTLAIASIVGMISDRPGRREWFLDAPLRPDDFLVRGMGTYMESALL